MKYRLLLFVLVLVSVCVAARKPKKKAGRSGSVGSGGKVDCGGSGGKVGRVFFGRRHERGADCGADAHEQRTGLVRVRYERRPACRHQPSMDGVEREVAHLHPHF